MHSVLVVDDDPTLRQVVTSWVNELGFSVHEAHSAEHALDVLTAVRPDLVVCDVNMPGRDGVWLASRIREMSPRTAIIMATAQRDVETAVSSLRNDVVDYLLKPFDRQRLQEALHLALDWHRSAVAADNLQSSLEDRLRSRRALVATALARAQPSPELAADGLIAILQLHEHDGREHATRVARLTIAVADELGLPDDEIVHLERGALLHDVGKIDMPRSILYKPAPLDEHEWRVMRTHPRVGYDLLRKLPSLNRAAEYVLAHHEAFDGSGYPRGLRGEEIPLGARILSIADSYDSMTRPHTQRPALPTAMAVREIERCSGLQFDPAVVQAFGQVLMNTVGRDDQRVA